MTEFDRRTLLSMFGSMAAIGLPACGSGETSRDGLQRLLGLSSDQADWLDVLNATEQTDLYEAVTRRAEPSARATALLEKLLAPRSRLMAFVGYGEAANRRTACDGLFRE